MTDSVVMRFPKAVRAINALPYLKASILAHEVEHAIQHRFSQASRRQYSTKSSEWFKSRFFSEAGAMVQEWRVAHAIPAAKRSELATEIKNSPLSVKDKKVFVRWIEESRLPLEEYIAQEHAAGRYSAEKFRHEYRMGLVENALGSSIEIAQLYLFYRVIAACARVAEMKSKNEYTAKFPEVVFESICRSILGPT